MGLRMPPSNLARNFLGTQKKKRGRGKYCTKSPERNRCLVARLATRRWCPSKNYLQHPLFDNSKASIALILLYRNYSNFQIYLSDRTMAYYSEENDEDWRDNKYGKSDDTESSSSLSSYRSYGENPHRRSKQEYRTTTAVEKRRHNDGESYHRHSSTSTKISDRRIKCTDRPSCTSERSKRSGRTQTSSSQKDNVIALFGAYGVTGHYFLQFALEAGYHVRTLLLPGVQLEDMHGSDNLTVVTGSLDDTNKIRRVVKSASYVVCMLSDCEEDLQHPPSAYDGTTPTSTLNFVKLLYPLLEEYGMCRVVLYQVR